MSSTANPYPGSPLNDVSAAEGSSSGSLNSPRRLSLRLCRRRTVSRDLEKCSKNTGRLHGHFAASGPTNGSRVSTSRQRTAARQAFELAGFHGRIMTAPITSEDERVFLLTRADLAGIADVKALETRLQEVLGRKVWIVEHTDQWCRTVPFA
jgi:hypothetical protein